MQLPVSQSGHLPTCSKIRKFVVPECVSEFLSGQGLSEKAGSNLPAFWLSGYGKFRSGLGKGEK